MALTILRESGRAMHVDDVLKAMGPNPGIKKAGLQASLQRGIQRGLCEKAGPAKFRVRREEGAK